MTLSAHDALSSRSRVGKRAWNGCCKGNVKGEPRGGKSKLKGFKGGQASRDREGVRRVVGETNEGE